MYLRKNHNKKTNRTYLSIVQGYRDKDGKTKSKTIKSIGYVDELVKSYDDPIAHFTKVAKEMDCIRLQKKEITININLDTQLDNTQCRRKNFGYIVFSKIYHELEIDRFLNNARRNESFEFNSEAIMRLLLYSRLLYPTSKRAAYMRKEQFFDSFDFSLGDVYSALMHFDKVSLKLQKHIHDKVKEQYNRSTELVYYDVTNYYFETDKQDELRRKGYSKENRKNPIVQMGLLIDKQGLPITYKIFSGNKHDSQTLLPILKTLKRDFNIKRLVIVVDKGLNSGDNIAFNTILGDGYIFSKSVRSASDSYKNWVLDADGYMANGTNKIKSKIVSDAMIYITTEKNGKKVKRKEMVEQKWIVFYSEKYALRAKYKRGEIIEKAMKIIENPDKFNRSYNCGAAAFIKNLKIDKDTGEILNQKETLILDIEKIKEDEKYDGYYGLITSELDNSDTSIIEAYKGLWRIEESFKITKSVLDTRPIFLRTEPHINAHFLICFIALLIARIVEMRLLGKYTIENITKTLQKVACSHIEQNIWLFDFVSEVTDDINMAFSTNFGSKTMTLSDIKSKFADMKN